MDAMKCNKDGWVKKKLGEVAKIKSGKSIKSEEIRPVSELNSYPCYGGNGIRGYVDHYLEEGDYPIIGRVGALCGNVRLASGKFYATEHALVVHINNSSLVYPKWLTNSLINLQLRQYAKGVAQPVLSASQISELCVLIPSFPEQQRIVSELDCLNGIIEKQKEQLKQLDELAQSIFYDMFGDPVENEKGWDSSALKVVAPSKVFNGEVPQTNGKYWLLNLDKIIPNTGELIQKDFYSLEEIGNSTYKFCEDNVLYSKLRPYLNKVLLPYDKGYATTELVPLCPNKDLLNRIFFSALLRSYSFVNFIKGKVAGAKMPRVSMTTFNSFKVILPPISLQQHFASQIEAIEHQKELIKKSIAETETLFNSRMDYYFG